MSRLIADAHYDLGLVLFNRDQLGETEVIKNRILPMWQASNVKFVIAAIFIEDHFLPENGLRNALNQISLIKEEVKNLSNVIMIESSSDIDRIMHDDKIGIMLSLEGLEPIGTDINLLNTFYDLGVRAAGLTWSRQNSVADGSRFGDENTTNGLSNFGKKVIQTMRDKKMIVDVSHLNDAGLDDLNGLIIVSHSNARSVNNITRYLKDEHIKKIAASGGIIGINNIKPIVGGQESILEMCNHIDYIKNLVGYEHICFGFDLCNDIQITGIRYGNQSQDMIDTLTYNGVEELISELISRAYTDQMIESIMYGNLLRVIKESLKE